MSRETQGFDPEMEQGKRKQELFEDSVGKLVDQFKNNVAGLEELMAQKEKDWRDPNNRDTYQQVLDYKKEFEEALKRIEEGKDKEK